MRLSTKKQQTLLTLSVLLGLSSPVCAQDIQNNDVIVTPDVVGYSDTNSRGSKSCTANCRSNY